MRGGDPAAPSDTATLLRLHPNHRPTFDGWLLAVTPPASGVSNSRGVTGGVYKARERELQPAIRTESLFIGVRSASRLRFPLFKPIVGLRSLRDLTQHLTTRADDSHAPPVFTSPEGEGPISKSFAQCQALVRFFALRRIKPHTPPLVRAPSIPLSFNLAAVLPRRGTYCKGSIPPTPSTHRLRPGLPGYLIPFTPWLSRLSVRHSPESRLRHWCSSQYLRISPLHWEFHFPLLHSRSIVSDPSQG
ncbi:hypothetical protein Lal_00007124 [Lupinus albus]|nr:hypothetical protein Lal_00007124 [Lupinus albus]